MEARRVEIDHAYRTHAHTCRDCNGSAIGDDVVVGDGVNNGTHGYPPLRRSRSAREVKKIKMVPFTFAKGLWFLLDLTSWLLLRVAKLQNYSCKLEIYRQKGLKAIESCELGNRENNIFWAGTRVRRNIGRKVRADSQKNCRLSLRERARFREAKNDATVYI